MRTKPPNTRNAPKPSSENARGIRDDKTRRELLRQADECEAIAAALAGKLPRDKARK
jgi:hypothetical protein